MEKFIGKGKHTIKVRNHPRTKLVVRLKDKSSKIICIHNKQLRDTQNNLMQNIISKRVIMRGGGYKCRLFKMCLKLRDQQLKPSMYKYRLLYKNLMVTAKQKSIVDIHTKKKKEYKRNTEESHQIIRQKKKGEKRPELNGNLAVC